jgi:hypothetical protein
MRFHSTLQLDAVLGNANRGPQAAGSAGELAMNTVFSIVDQLQKWCNENSPDTPAAAASQAASEVQ